MPKLSCAAGSTSVPCVRLYYIIDQAAEAEPRSQRRHRPFLERANRIFWRLPRTRTISGVG